MEGDQKSGKRTSVHRKKRTSQEGIIIAKKSQLLKKKNKLMPQPSIHGTIKQILEKKKTPKETIKP